MSSKKRQLEYKEQARQVFKNGLILFQQGKTEDANKLFSQAHQLDKNNSDALNFLGIISYQKQDYKNALHFLNAANAIEPNCTQTLNNLSLVYNSMLQFHKALEYCDRAIERNGSVPEIHNNRGNALKGLGRYLDAINAYRKAVELRPNYSEALSNQGIALLEQNLPENAISLFHQAINANPNLAPAFNSLGNALMLLGNPEDAIKSFERAIQINPDYLDAYLNFGNCLRKFNQYEEAIRCYQYALKISPKHAKIYYLLGEVYYDIGNSALAKAYLQNSLSIDPFNLEAQFALAIAQIPKVVENINEISESRASFSNQLSALQNNTIEELEPNVVSKLIARHPFYLAYQAQDNKQLISQFGLVCRHRAKTLQNKLLNIYQQQGTSKKIRVGIVSHFFCDHPVWHAITKAWVNHLNPNIFEIYLLNTDGNEDGETEQAKSKASSYLNCSNSSAVAAPLIFELNFDVILYPEIGMDTTSKALACLRLAPIQAVSWGHPETTGLPTIDIYLSGELLEPISASNNYTEELIKLPNLGTYFERPSTAITDPNLPKIGVVTGAPLLLCPGSPAKYNPIQDQILIEIAKRLGCCQFIFFNFEENLARILEERIRRAFFTARLNPDEFIKFIPFQKKGEFYGLMHKADLYLDTIGFSGFNTAMQAIYCNLPIITIEGKWMRGRLASAILQKMGLSSLVCQTTQQYVDTTVELIQNSDLLESYKTIIGTQKWELFEDLTPIRALEDFLIQRINKNT